MGGHKVMDEEDILVRLRQRKCQYKTTEKLRWCRGVMAKLISWVRVDRERDLISKTHM
jgi:hypothetical protein